jgi:hypothetical protein
VQADERELAGVLGLSDDPVPGLAAAEEDASLRHEAGV